MYENYLLNPSAIREVLSSEDRGATELKVEAIEAFIHNARKEKRYYGEDGVKELWRQHIRDMLLTHLLAPFSQARVTFEKPRHSVLLTEWLLEHDPDALRDIRGILPSVLS